jgi:hypothetical protein
LTSLPSPCPHCALIAVCLISVASWPSLPCKCHLYGLIVLSCSFVSSLPSLCHHVLPELILQPFPTQAQRSQRYAIPRALRRRVPHQPIMPVLATSTLRWSCICRAVHGNGTVHGWACGREPPFVRAHGLAKEPHCPTRSVLAHTASYSLTLPHTASHCPAPPHTTPHDQHILEPPHTASPRLSLTAPSRSSL